MSTDGTPAIVVALDVRPCTFCGEINRNAPFILNVREGRGGFWCSQECADADEVKRALEPDPLKCGACMASFGIRQGAPRDQEIIEPVELPWEPGTVICVQCAEKSYGYNPNTDTWRGLSSRRCER